LKNAGLGRDGLLEGRKRSWSSMAIPRVGSYLKVLRSVYYACSNQSSQWETLGSLGIACLGELGLGFGGAPLHLAEQKARNPALRAGKSSG
jgi:hypothetical protein